MTSKISLENTPWSECECGGKIFLPVLMFKRISSLLSSDGQEHFVPVEIFKCESCGLIPGFISDKVPGIPDDLKAKKSLI